MTVDDHKTERNNMKIKLSSASRILKTRVFPVANERIKQCFDTCPVML